MTALQIKLDSYETLLNELVNNLIGVVSYQEGLEYLKDGSRNWFIPDYMQVHERGDHAYVTMGAYLKVETFGIKFHPNAAGKFDYTW